MKGFVSGCINIAIPETKIDCKYYKKKNRHGRDSNPRSLVYETNALPLGHRAMDFLVGLFNVI